MCEGVLVSGSKRHCQWHAELYGCGGLVLCVLVYLTQWLRAEFSGGRGLQEMSTVCMLKCCSPGGLETCIKQTCSKHSAGVCLVGAGWSLS